MREGDARVPEDEDGAELGIIDEVFLVDACAVAERIAVEEYVVPYRASFEPGKEIAVATAREKPKRIVPPIPA